MFGSTAIDVGNCHQPLPYDQLRLVHGHGEGYTECTGCSDQLKCRKVPRQPGPCVNSSSPTCPRRKASSLTSSGFPSNTNGPVHRSSRAWDRTRDLRVNSTSLLPAELLWNEKARRDLST